MPSHIETLAHYRTLAAYAMLPSLCQTLLQILDHPPIRVAAVECGLADAMYWTAANLTDTLTVIAEGSGR